MTNSIFPPPPLMAGSLTLSTAVIDHFIRQNAQFSPITGPPITSLKITFQPITDKRKNLRWKLSQLMCFPQIYTREALKHKT